MVPTHQKCIRIYNIGMISNGKTIRTGNCDPCISNDFRTAPNCLRKNMYLCSLKKLFQTFQAVRNILRDKEIVFLSPESHNLANQFILVHWSLNAVNNSFPPADVFQLEGCHQLQFRPAVSLGTLRRITLF